MQCFQAEHFLNNNHNCGLSSDVGVIINIIWFVEESVIKRTVAVFFHQDAVFISIDVGVTNIMTLVFIFCFAEESVIKRTVTVFSTRMLL